MDELSTVAALVQLSFLVHGVVVDAGAAHDLSIAQVRLLGVLRDREPGMQELAGHLGLDKSSVTGLVDRAERRGLVRRMPSAQDGRAVIVTTTPAGRRVAAKVAAVVTAQVDEVVGPLTAQQRRELTRLAAKVL